MEAKDFHAKADECEELAKHCTIPSLAEEYRDLAKQWRELAEQVEKYRL